MTYLFTWADLITILVADEVIRSKQAIEKLYIQRKLDRKDTKAEYGGIIDTDATSDLHCAIRFRPRARDRASRCSLVSSI